ncbi:hypothetical protein GCM10010495_54780 [Kitasatospora herbaricolor]|uniref:hypothetical protein n=1 Tax=Kitasatospora herbaricolor TaxID=68217 RepID=UPI00174BF12E|nr:hypothetical protein [Kitasatospora herbaricolor]MDQ0307216.1 hypothetical protein [Kitasatospora herbaricolor]GGV31284.1 hypothetical protein GCM10010495_54780 [Kitasatospora herbaricolor]
MSPFALSYESWFRPIAVCCGTGPARSGAVVDGGLLTVRMGWAFRAVIPLSSIAAARADAGPVPGWGVHGFGGRWLVNGSARGLVLLRVEPRCRATAALVPVRLRELRLSLERPEDFLAALGRPA